MEEEEEEEEEGKRVTIDWKKQDKNLVVSLRPVVSSPMHQQNKNILTMANSRRVRVRLF